MPIYEYQCPACGNVFEEWVKTANDQEEKSCAQCGGMAQRMISNTAFILKGGGWYVTDYGYRKGVSEEGKPGAGAKPEGASEAPGAAASDSGAAATGAARGGESGSQGAPAPAAPAASSASSPAAPAASSAPASNIGATGS